MPVIIGPVQAAIQTGGRLATGNLLAVTKKNNLHMTSRDNSFGQGKNNFQLSLLNAPAAVSTGLFTDIISSGRPGRGKKTGPQ